MNKSATFQFIVERQRHWVETRHLSNPVHAPFGEAEITALLRECDEIKPERWLAHD